MQKSKATSQNKEKKQKTIIKGNDSKCMAAELMETMAQLASMKTEFVPPVIEKMEIKQEKEIKPKKNNLFRLLFKSGPKSKSTKCTPAQLKETMARLANQTIPDYIAPADLKSASMNAKCTPAQLKDIAAKLETETVPKSTGPPIAESAPKVEVKQEVKAEVKKEVKIEVKIEFKEKKPRSTLKQKCQKIWFNMKEIVLIIQIDYIGI